MFAVLFNMLQSYAVLNFPALLVFICIVPLHMIQSQTALYCPLLPQTVLALIFAILLHMIQSYAVLYFPTLSWLLFHCYFSYDRVPNYFLLFLSSLSCSSNISFCSISQDVVVHCLLLPHTVLKTIFIVSFHKIQSLTALYYSLLP